MTASASVATRQYGIVKCLKKLILWKISARKALLKIEERVPSVKKLGLAGLKIAYC